jgi:hypothetical protein
MNEMGIAKTTITTEIFSGTGTTGFKGFGFEMGGGHGVLKSDKKVSMRAIKPAF